MLFLPKSDISVPTIKSTLEFCEVRLPPISICVAILDRISIIKYIAQRTTDDDLNLEEVKGESLINHSRITGTKNKTHTNVLHSVTTT